MAGVVALHAHGDVRGPLGRRGALCDPRRPSELAVGPPPPCMEAAAVHGADARPQRRVPPSAERRGLAAVRRCRAPFHDRALWLERARLVAGRPAPCIRWRTVPLPTGARRRRLRRTTCNHPIGLSTSAIACARTAWGRSSGRPEVCVGHEVRTARRAGGAGGARRVGYSCGGHDRPGVPSGPPPEGAVVTLVIKLLPGTH